MSVTSMDSSIKFRSESACGVGRRSMGWMHRKHAASTSAEGISVRRLSSEAKESRRGSDQPRFDINPVVHLLGLSTVGAAIWLFYGMVEEDKAKHRGVWDPDRELALERARASEDPDALRPRVYMDLAIDGAPAGRLVIKLRDDIAPRTCEAFRSMVQSGGHGSFRGTVFDRVVPGFIVQGGARTDGAGQGKAAEPGRPLQVAGEGDQQQYPLDESFVLPHSHKGVVALATPASSPAASRDPGSMPFYVLMAPGGAPHLNGKHVVFGEVDSAGLKVLDRIEAMHTKVAEAEAGAHDAASTGRVPTVAVEGCGDVHRRRTIAPNAVSAQREFMQGVQRRKTNQTGAKQNP